MSVSSIGSAATGQYYSQYDSGLVSLLDASGTGSGSAVPSADYVTNLGQAAQDQAILATKPGLTETISQQSASPQLMSSSEALGTLTGAGESTTQSQSSLVSLAYSMQLMQSLSGSGALTNNSSLAQALIQNYSNSAATTPGSLVDTSG